MKEALFSKQDTCFFFLVFSSYSPQHTWLMRRTSQTHVVVIPQQTCFRNCKNKTLIWWCSRTYLCTVHLSWRATYGQRCMCAFRNDICLPLLVFVLPIWLPMVQYSLHKPPALNLGSSKLNVSLRWSWWGGTETWAADNLRWLLN